MSLLAGPQPQPHSPATTTAPVSPHRLPNRNGLDDMHCLLAGFLYRVPPAFVLPTKSHPACYLRPSAIKVVRSIAATLAWPHQRPRGPARPLSVAYTHLTPSRPQCRIQTQLRPTSHSSLLSRRRTLLCSRRMTSLKISQSRVSPTLPRPVPCLLRTPSFSPFDSDPVRLISITSLSNGHF